MRSGSDVRTRPTDSSAADRSASTTRSTSSCSASKATVSWADIKGGTNTGSVFGAPLGATFNTEVDWASTLTGRVGVAFDRWLVYGKGGVAWASDSYTTNLYTFPASVEMTDTRIGWTAGAGVEYAFAPRWSAKLEYNYMDFGTKPFRSRRGPRPTSTSRSMRSSSA